jgi:hypothetical protein
VLDDKQNKRNPHLSRPSRCTCARRQCPGLLHTRHGTGKRHVVDA